MHINVMIFGQLTDLTGANLLEFENINNTNQLVDKLTAAYPSLASAKYALAVDKKIVKENTVLQNNSTIALLPPFSGG